MKTILAFFILILAPPQSFAALVCNDINGSPIAVLGQEKANNYSLIVKLDASTQKSYAVRKSSDGVYRSLTGFLNARPVLDLNAQTLKMGGLIYDVECSQYRGS